MKKIQLDRTRTLTALLIGIMALPALLHGFPDRVETPSADLLAIYRSIDDEGRILEVVEDMKEKALEYRDEFRAQRRAYSRAVVRCENRLRDGEDIVCPEFNDTSTYDYDAHPAAPAKVEKVDTSSLSDWKELTIRERSLLRSYTRAGFCSKAAGILLYDLCMEMLGESAVKTSPIGIKSDIQGIREANQKAGPATLKFRLQMIDEAISGSKSKRATVRPMGWTEDMNK